MMWIEKTSYKTDHVADEAIGIDVHCCCPVLKAWVETLRRHPGLRASDTGPRELTESDISNARQSEIRQQRIVTIADQDIGLKTT
jgi:hypothetical protein